MTARRVSDDPRLVPLYAERDRLEGERDVIAKRLAAIQGEVLAILHPHGVKVTGTHPLHYRRLHDARETPPRVDAVQLQVLDTSPRVEVEIFAPLPEPCAYTEALFEDREPGPSFDGLKSVLSALPDEQPGFYAIHEFEEKDQ